MGFDWRRVSASHGWASCEIWDSVARSRIFGAGVGSLGGKWAIGVFARFGGFTWAKRCDTEVKCVACMVLWEGFSRCYSSKSRL